MKNGANAGSEFSTEIAALREFNRFYTTRLGLLRRRHLGGQFSLSEARVLYEIGARPEITASTLRALLELDAGYVSRLLSSLANRRFLRQITSKVDGREKLLILNKTGREAVARINEQSVEQIRGMLAQMSDTDRGILRASITKIRSILSGRSKEPVQIVRLDSVNDDVLAILHEYYEAVNVTQRDSLRAVQAFVDAPASGIWLAYLKDEFVGCVVLRKLDSIPFASECKRLYVRPNARGNRIADRLLDAQEEFARSRGVQWIYLDSYEDLRAAIALYKKRGYEHCARYNDNPQATLFMRKRI
jgi:DNA-binding MarR family transcriptional regulator/GNAT superfamily N-acetyltransferase